MAEAFQWLLLVLYGIGTVSAVLISLAAYGLAKSQEKKPRLSDEETAVLAVKVIKFLAALGDNKKIKDIKEKDFKESELN
jgi:Na+-transporting NADH:ubiquinone oxidoreductase subunit NqrC